MTGSGRTRLPGTEERIGAGLRAARSGREQIGKPTLRICRADDEILVSDIPLAGGETRTAAESRARDRRSYKSSGKMYVMLR